MRIDGAQGVVTGGAAGIGAAITRRLVRAGVDVLIADADGDTAAKTAGEVGARFVVADLATEEGVKEVMSEADRLWDGLDILVNNAGGVWRPYYPQAEPERWGRVIDLNLRAVMLATQLALRRMESRGGGAVVNIASTGGLLEGGYDKPEYGAAKAGVMRFTDALAPLKDRIGVRVNGICPDLVDTPSSRTDRAGMTAAERAALPPALSTDQIADLAHDLIVDDDLAGCIFVHRGGRPPTLLPRSPLPAPRSPLPAPRSPLPAPRSPLPAPRSPL